MDGSGSQECIICCDVTESYVLCSDEGHATCDECFERYVDDKVSKLKQTNLLASKAETAELESDSARILMLAGRIFCPRHGACGCTSSQPFDDRTVALHLPSDKVASYIEARALLPAARQVQASLQKGAEMRALFPNARQCGRCSFGPIVTGARDCNDLTSHHGEPAGRYGAARIDNACPRCGWFANSFDQWAEWDGASSSVANPYAETSMLEPSAADVDQAAVAEEVEDEDAATRRRAQRAEDLRAFHEERHGMRHGHHFQQHVFLGHGNAFVEPMDEHDGLMEFHYRLEELGVGRGLVLRRELTAQEQVERARERIQQLDQGRARLQRETQRQEQQLTERIQVHREELERNLARVVQEHEEQRASRREPASLAEAMFGQGEVARQQARSSSGRRQRQREVRQRG